MEKVTYDLTTAAGVDAMEANLNAVEPSLRETERLLGLPWGLEIGRRRALIRARREGICEWCDKPPSNTDVPQPWLCKCGRKVWKV